MVQIKRVGIICFGILLTTVCEFAVVGCGSHREVNKSAPPIVTWNTPEGNLALSLKALVELARKDIGTGRLSDEVRLLGGLTRVEGYVIDRKNEDIILVGRAERGAPAMHLDDFVVALRCVWKLYAEQKGDTLNYTPPGVSIDPNPQTLAELNRIQRRVFQNQDPEAIRVGLKEWKRIAQGPQNTRILGMPPTHLAEVALQADYRMKRIVDGSETVPGIVSLTRLREQAGNSTPGSSLDRFWFVAKPDPTFVEDEDIILFQSAPISLLTEAEALIDRNTIAGSGTADPLASRFCENFSQHYRELARRPVYAELESGFRWIGLATLLERQRAFEQSGLSPDFFLKELIPASVNIPETLPGIANVRSVSSKTAGGRHYRWSMTVGGVDMRVVIPDENIQWDSEGRLRKSAEVVLQTRPGSLTLTWRLEPDALGLTAFK